MSVSIVHGVNLHVPSSKVHVHADAHSPAAMAGAVVWLKEYIPKWSTIPGNFINTQSCTKTSATINHPASMCVCTLMAFWFVWGELKGDSCSLCKAEDTVTYRLWQSESAEQEVTLKRPTTSPWMIPKEVAEGLHLERWLALEMTVLVRGSDMN